MTITLYLILWLFTTSASAADADLEQRVLKLEQEITLLKQQVESLKSAGQAASASPASPPLAPATLGSADNVGQPQLSLLQWSFRPVTIKFDTYYALDVELRNGFNKAIKEVQARIDFRDLGGDLFYSISLSSTLNIPAGGTVVDDGNRRNKRLLGRGHQMVTMGVENIKAALVVEKLVFEDGTILTF